MKEAKRGGAWVRKRSLSDHVQIIARCERGKIPDARTQWGEKQAIRPESLFSHETATCIGSGELSQEGELYGEREKSGKMKCTAAPKMGRGLSVNGSARR